MQCPKCGLEQPVGAECQSCGIVFDKYNARRSDEAARRATEENRARSTRRARRLEHGLRFSFLVCALLAVLSYKYKDQHPGPDFYDQARLTEPLQVKTRTQPFQVQANGVVYTIDPLFDYELNGMVVSEYTSGELGDIYHHDRWKDFINIKDLCVIWGHNVAGGVYQEMSFSNSPWICRAYWPSQEVGTRFRQSQLSNNHLLTNRPEVNEAIMQSEPGDQVHFKGMLARYSHSHGKFRRGTSTSRTDTGNGACETVFVTDFEIVKKANSGWRKLFAFALGGAILSLIGFLVMFAIAPARRA